MIEVGKLTRRESGPLRSILVQERLDVPVHQLKFYLSVRARRTAQIGQLGKHFQLSRERNGDNWPADTGVRAPAVVNVVGVGAIEVDGIGVGEFLRIFAGSNKVDIDLVALFDRNRALSVMDRCSIGGDDAHETKGRSSEAEPGGSISRM